ncbi:Retrovirus-related Pol polyprotein from transposon TNT 1-94 [Eumeta japonica]|uniref:Retrovirus-related Pol polyprotein from transposon TNT 1-94 n=1 Tax=Eumeta variegata TaxID=151549 RepID=A0A4C1V5C0_EUMVA|nr:Retrovirus-related Pol polyprotein from transposon TNT 1-94 [Eumeta japonica]
MIMAIEHLGINITADAIKIKLMDLEEDNGDVNGAFASYRKKHDGNTGTRSQSSTSTSMSKQKVIKCYKCKQTGPYRNQCRKDYVKDSSNNKSSERKQTNAFSTVFLNSGFSRSDWYIDSGASGHLTANEHWITNVSNNHTVKEIIVANKEKVSVNCSGDVRLTTLTDNCEYDVVVEGVLCVPSLTKNLISVSRLIAKGNKVLFKDDGCQIFNKRSELVATACLLNGVYKLRMPERQLAAVVTSSEIWHRRLGHVNNNYLSKMQEAVEGLLLDREAKISKSSCIVCCEGKPNRLPFPRNGNRSDDLLHIMHTDVCGPFKTVSLGGSRYFILFIDDYSRYTYIYFLKNKNEAFECFQKYKAKVKNKLNRKIKILRSDNGKEFVNKEFDNYLNKAGIVHQKSNPYTPEQNGLAERFNRTVVEKARCLLFDAEMDENFWAEAANTAVYLQNRIVSANLNGTPFEMWNGVKPDISHLKVFGSVMMMHIPKEKRLKWNKKAVKEILVGFPEDVKGYRVYNPSTKDITTSRDVIIMENNKQIESVVQIEENKQSQFIEDSVGDTSYESISETFHDNDETYLPDDSSDDSVENVVSVKRSGSSRQRKQPDRYGHSNMCLESGDIQNVCELSLVEALKAPEKEQWLEAIKDELQCFDDNNAWELTEAPKDSISPILKCKWVLCKKYDSESRVRFRARLVAKGFLQKQGVDYTETFSPVVRHTTLRLLFSLSVQLDLYVTHLDVKTAFLNGNLEENIYMQKPECFDSSDNSKKVLKLNKAIYGLKQASRALNKEVDSCLIENGYKKSKLEPYMYTKNFENIVTIVALYVDDVFIFSNDKKESDSLKEILSNEFQIKDLGQVKQCLG